MGVVAAAALRRASWAVAVTLAAVALTLLALIGSRPDSAFVRFRPAGVMRSIEPAEVTVARVTSGATVWRFTRGAAGEWTGGDPAASAAAVCEAVRLLHAAPPHRTLAHEELGEASLAEFGLDPPRYLVSLETAGREPFRVRFGGPSATGVAQYAQIEGRREVVLLPRYVGEAWERATGMR